MPLLRQGFILSNQARMVDAFDTWFQALSLSGMPGKVYRSVGQVCRLMPVIILHMWALSFNPPTGRA